MKRTRRRVAQGDTASQILDVAERLVQRRGFNGFSYADVAAELGMTTAALHYHFPGKAELGEALVARYGERFVQTLAAIGAKSTRAPTKLRTYANLYRDVLAHQRMCLCGMLAAEYQTLPKPMRGALLRFFDDNERWLRGVLDQGRQEGSLQFTGSPNDTARLIVSALEGTMLVTRPYADIARFEDTAARLIASLTAPPRSVSTR
jgi:TetR/AcrR family transcriptional regulator, transcriptional repressor for nem operon